ncbi:MAG: flagellar biosynthesis anti-sigma factor FlgM [Pseudomonadota bacterium]
MANDITGISNRPAPVSPTSAPVAKEAPSASTGPHDDSVALSLPGLLSEANAVMDKTPTVNEARVRELTNAIAEGRYQPDMARVASKMLDVEAAITNAQSDDNDA